MNPIERRKEVEAKFVQITDAYNTLSDLKRREALNMGKETSSNSGYKASWNNYRRVNTNFTYGAAPYSGDRFNVKVWNAWHYGQHDAAWVEAIKYRSSAAKNETPMSRHQAYFHRRRQREAERTSRQDIRDNLDRKRNERINRNANRQKRNECAVM